MFWKFKRRLRNGFWKNGLYYSCFLICFVLFINLMVLKRNFETLNSENYIDAGGTTPLEKDPTYKIIKFNRNTNVVNNRVNMRYVFENRLRKLLDIIESNLDNAATYGTSEHEDGLDTYFPDRLLYCDDVRSITNMTYLASGWTKAVYKGLYKGSPVAVKTVDVNGQEVQTCMTSGMSEALCYVKAAKKIVKEIVVLQAVAGNNVLKVLGFCLPRDADDNLYVAMVTELGEAVDLIKLLQMSWEDRLRICLDITKIIRMMSETQYGSMSMNDFRRQQFVLVDGTLKLSDVDDTGFDDPVCKTSTDCDVIFSSANFSQSTKCINSKCVEVNEKKNTFNAGRHFVTFLLPHGAPKSLQSIISQIVDAYSNLTMTSSQLQDKLEELVKLYQSGVYLKRSNVAESQTRYKRFPETDMPGYHDYRCRLSLSVATCTVSVYDTREAEEICEEDGQCKGFVMSYQKTWTGRTLVHFKNDIGNLSFTSNMTLFVRPD